MQDTRTFIGFVIIGLLIMVWIFMISPTPKPDQHPATPVDTAAQVAAAPAAPRDTTPAVSDSARVANSFGALFAPFTHGVEKHTVVHTSLYTASVSTRGGALEHLELAKYKTWNGYPVNIVDPERGGQVNMLFESSEGKLISTKDLYFTGDAPPAITVERDSTVLTYTLRIDSVRSIVKRLTFRDGTYEIGVDFILNHCESVIGNYHYQVTWDHAIPFAEHNSIDESGSAEAAAYQNGELQKVDADKFGDPIRKTPSGSTQWVAARNKYFVAALLAPQAADGAYLEGRRIGLPDNGAKEEYDIALQFPYRKGAVEQARVNVYAGPLDYHVVRGLGVGLEEFMSFGWAWIVRPIGIYFMLPVFSVIHMVIANYGLVIIIFSIFIKLLLTPLSIGQMRSAKKMQLMQPIIAELKEKFKDDPAKMNQETMKLYSTYGINPLGGCLPLLMQMPLLYAMWALLRNAIELRQAAFVGWISDLSVPDVLVTLPFKLPLFGVQNISGLAVLMAIAMFIQQKMTLNDPRQKAMLYVMPIMLALMFMSFPSGLNLYYLMFNVLSIGQQLYFNKKHSEIKLVPVDKKAKPGKPGKPGKMSFTQRVLAAQQEAMKQQRSRKN